MNSDQRPAQGPAELKLGLITVDAGNSGKKFNREGWRRYEQTKADKKGRADREDIDTSPSGGQAEQPPPKEGGCAGVDR